MARPGEGLYTSLHLSLFPLTPVSSEQSGCTVYTAEATKWRRVYNLWTRSDKFWSPHERKHYSRARSVIGRLLVERRWRQRRADVHLPVESQFEGLLRGHHVCPSKTEGISYLVRKRFYGSSRTSRSPSSGRFGPSECTLCHPYQLILE